MRRHGFAQLELQGCQAHSTLKDAFVEVVTPHKVSERVGSPLRGGENVLPRPFARGIGIFCFQGIRQGDFAIAFAQVFVMQGFYTLQMDAKLDSEEGKRIYARRLGIVEPVFANIYSGPVKLDTKKGEVKVASEP